MSSALIGAEITDPALQKKWGMSTRFTIEYHTLMRLTMLTSLADVVRLECPFYYELRKLLGQCPNYKPASIGNSKSPAINDGEGGSAR